MQEGIGSPMSTSVRIKSAVERKHPRLPRFLVIPSKAIARWRLNATTVVEMTINGVEAGRRTLKKWDDARWFIDVPEPVCRKAGIDIGDTVVVSLRLASTELPDELARLLATSPAAKAVWQGLTPSQQRMLQEHVASAKQSATRLRRAMKALSASFD